MSYSEKSDKTPLFCSPRVENSEATASPVANDGPAVCAPRPFIKVALPGTYYDFHGIPFRCFAVHQGFAYGDTVFSDAFIRVPISSLKVLA